MFFVNVFRNLFLLNTVSGIVLGLLQNERGSCKFMVFLKTVTCYWKKIFRFITQAYVWYCMSFKLFVNV